MNNKTYHNWAKSFSDIQVGDEAQFEVVITEEMHQAFSRLFNDYSPIHCDDQFSSETKFEKKIGYAFLLTGFLSTLYGEYLPGGSSICIKQDAQFIKPFFIGDKITVKGTVVNKIVSTRFVEIKSKMYRNEGECIFRGSGVVQVIFDKKMTQPLYEVEGKRLYYSDFINALKGIGVKKGDIVFVHSDISVFGKLCTFDRDFLLGTLCKAIKESVGEDGTIIMPSFSYSFCKDEPYDVVNTRSTVGVLTEHFRKQPDVSRTVHPIFSVGIWGKHKNALLDIGKDSFDRASIFGKIHQLNGKILFLGAPFQSCTYVHYVEQMHGVPYRYLKTFEGKIINVNMEYQDRYTFFVRDLEKNVIFETAKLERYLIGNGFMKEVILGNGRILMIECNVLFNECWILLDKDIYFLLKEKPAN